MLPTTALVLYETYFGHRLLSVRRWVNIKMSTVGEGVQSEKNVRSLLSRNNFI
jgi:hypothetical protein